MLLLVPDILFVAAMLPGKHYDVTSVTVQQARDLIDSGAVIIDVREEKAN